MYRKAVILNISTVYFDQMNTASVSLLKTVKITSRKIVKKSYHDIIKNNNKIYLS